MPLVSVILPVRPSSERLNKVIDSLLSQTYQDWELIALLDRDQNKFNELALDKKIEPGRLVKIPVNYPTMGFPRILNIGIEAAGGDFIARLDDDDISANDRILLQKEFLTTNPTVGLVCSHARVISTEGTSLYEIKPSTDSNILKHQLLTQNVIPHSSVMFRKSLWQKLNGYNEKISGCEDYEFWLRMISKTEFATIDSSLITHLMNPTGMTKSKIPKESIKSVRYARRNAQRYLGISRIIGEIQNLKWEAQQK